jgi:hypothetical protein
MGLSIGAITLLPARAQEDEGTTPAAKPAEGKAKQPAEILQFVDADEPDNESLVREALEQYVTLRFENLPMKDLAEAVGKKSGISVVINEQALTDEGVNLDVPITLKVSRVTLRSALRLALDPLQLRAVVENEVLMITTASEAVNYRNLVVYDVTDLHEARRNQAGESNLLRLIMNSTGGEPDGPWAQVDGEGGEIGLLPVGDTMLLVVRQTDVVHQQIEKLLSDTRTALEQDNEEEPVVATTAAAVEKRLRRRVNANFVEVTWERAVRTLAAGLGVPVQIDKAIDESAQVTLRMKNAKAATILERLLKPNGLGWQVSDAGLRIAKIDALDQESELRVYDVRDFFRIPADAKGIDFKSLIELVQSLEGAPREDGKGPALEVAGTQMQGLPMLVVKGPHGRQVGVAKLFEEMRASRQRFAPRGFGGMGMGGMGMGGGMTSTPPTPPAAPTNANVKEPQPPKEPPATPEKVKE